MFKAGDVVWWDDPDGGISSGEWEITDVGPEIVRLKNRSGSEAEVFRHEIRKVEK